MSLMDWIVPFLSIVSFGRALSLSHSAMAAFSHLKIASYKKGPSHDGRLCGGSDGSDCGI